MAASRPIEARRAQVEEGGGVGARSREREKLLSDDEKDLAIFGGEGSVLLIEDVVTFEAAQRHAADTVVYMKVIFFEI